jgi:hypothetical protein
MFCSSVGCVEVASCDPPSSEQEVNDAVNNKDPNISIAFDWLVFLPLRRSMILQIRAFFNSAER